MAGFAITALILASVGVYGVLAYSVASRRREFGVRLAVGASKGQVLRSVLREAAISGAVAVGIGLAAALALRRLLESLLFGVTPADLTTLATATAAMIVVALAAATLPARAATGVDPAIVLRAD